MNWKFSQFSAPHFEALWKTQLSQIKRTNWSKLPPYIQWIVLETTRQRSPDEGWVAWWKNALDACDPRVKIKIVGRREIATALDRAINAATHKDLRDTIDHDIFPFIKDLLEKKELRYLAIALLVFAMFITLLVFGLGAYITKIKPVA